VTAGIADSPLPVLSVGQTTLHLYSVPGVVNANGVTLGTVFSCTSTSTSSIVMGVELFGPSGGGPINVVSPLSVPAGGSVTIGTGGAAAFSVDQSLSPGPVSNGSARILATDKKLVCTAFTADYANSPPTSMKELTIIAKVKEKAAN
jgi:hypothetical protein